MLLNLRFLPDSLNARPLTGHASKKLQPGLLNKQIRPIHEHTNTFPTPCSGPARASPPFQKWGEAHLSALHAIERG